MRERRRHAEQAGGQRKRERRTHLSRACANRVRASAFFSMAVGPSVSPHSAQQRAKLREQTLAREKRSRMALFEADLGTLGLSLEEAVGLDDVVDVVDTHQ